MRLVPAAETVPNSVNRYLLPQERQVITVRMHPASMIGPGVTLAGVLTAAAKYARRSGRPEAVWYASGLVAADCVRRIAGWPGTYFVITSHRMLVIQGTLVRTVTEIPLRDIESLEFRRTILGRLLGYGSLAPRSGGGRRLLPRVRHLPYPEQLYLEISGLRYPRAEADWEDDDL
jgi:Bacterial PH domain